MKDVPQRTATSTKRFLKHIERSLSAVQFVGCEIKFVRENGVPCTL